MKLTQCPICDNQYVLSMFNYHCPACATIPMRVNGGYVTYPDMKSIARVDV